MVNPNPGLSLLDPYVKITLGSLGSQDGDTFIIGDGKLISASVTLGEGKVQSSCSFTVLDPDKKLADKYFSYIETVGGLDPIPDPEAQSNNSNTTPVTDPNQSNSTAGKVIFDNVQASTYDGKGKTGGGAKGAYGDVIDFNGYYAAMVDTKYKYATMRVTNLANNKSVVVKVVDRGPFAVDSNGNTIYPLRENPTRKIDLTPKAFSELAPISQGIINVKIEWIEAETTTASSSNKNKTVQEIVQEDYQKTKQEKASNNPFKAEKIGDWPLPKVGPTKSILLIPGHLVDTNSGGGGDTTYNGESRSIESVANILTVEVLKNELSKAGYTVLTPTTSSRGLAVVKDDGVYNSSQQNVFLDSITKYKNQGYYVSEIHFDDAAGGGGESGVIPERLNSESNGSSLSVMSVALANKIGFFPYGYRKILGAPRRGISMIEMGPISPYSSYISSGNYNGFKAAILPTVKKIVEAFNTVASASAASKAAESTSTTPTKEAVPTPVTLAGSQITVELGYGGKTIAAYSFIHTGLRFSLFEPNALEFTGQAASWVMTQRIKNTVYQNMSFKKIAQRITSSYGMKLDMPEEGPTYNYFPQRGQTDYEALLIEARRIGYRVYTKGATLSIKPRAGVITDKEIFVLEYGSNMGTSFEAVHQAQKDAEGGARSSVPGANNSTGERKYEIDPDTGQMVQKRKENVIGTGRDSAIATTGSPIKAPAPKTTGTTDKQDADRKANEDRIKGIIANADFPTTPEALTLDPDTPFLTKGISDSLDRMWVVDTVIHVYKKGYFNTIIKCYSPLHNKNYSADIASTDTTNISSTTSSPTDFIIPTKGVYTSEFGPRWGRNHNGVDIAEILGTPIYAAASGTATIGASGCLFSPIGNNVINRGCGGGFGNHVIINHANGYQTIYAHLSEITIENNTQVSQGQMIGKMGNSGASNGTHLHWEVRLNGKPINPGSVVKLPFLLSRIF
ncbi:putative peptidase [Calothrix brevissima NIES-22]|nr:putative peptidase [Calothrix brevissima NIES-22]